MGSCECTPACKALVAQPHRITRAWGAVIGKEAAEGAEGEDALLFSSSQSRGIEESTECGKRSELPLKAGETDARLFPALARAGERRPPLPLASATQSSEASLPYSSISSYQLPSIMVTTPSHHEMGKAGQEQRGGRYRDGDAGEGEAPPKSVHYDPRVDQLLEMVSKLQGEVVRLTATKSPDAKPAASESTRSQASGTADADASTFSRPTSERRPDKPAISAEGSDKHHRQKTSREPSKEASAKGSDRTALDTCVDAATGSRPSSERGPDGLEISAEGSDKHRRQKTGKEPCADPSAKESWFGDAATGSGPTSDRRPDGDGTSAEGSDRHRREKASRETSKDTSAKGSCSGDAATGSRPISERRPDGDATSAERSDAHHRQKSSREHSKEAVAKAFSKATHDKCAKSPEPISHAVAGSDRSSKDPDQLFVTAPAVKGRSPSPVRATKSEDPTAYRARRLHVSPVPDAAPSRLDAPKPVDYGHAKTDGTSPRSPKLSVLLDTAAAAASAVGVHFGRRSAVTAAHERRPSCPPGLQRVSQDASGGGTESQRPASSSPRPPHALASAVRPVCPEGSRCARRDRKHLASQAHPVDEDYEESCKAAGVPNQAPSLRVLFDWADVDRSGKASRTEIQAVMPLLARVSGGAMPDKIGQKAWERLDVDGNGAVNFSEFVDWAGPRLGLPLGVDSLLEGDRGAGCGVLGCLCMGFVDRDAASPSAPCSGRGGSAKSKQRRGQSGVKLCMRCGHKEHSHFSIIRVDSSGVPVPRYWKHLRGEEFSKLVAVPKEQLRVFQDLFDRTYLNRGTRDRSKGSVPKGYRVLSAMRNENSLMWRRYYIARGTLLAAVEGHASGEGLGPVALYRMRTAKAQQDMDTSSGVLDQLQSRCNEWYLFHGTSSQAARSICQSGFKMSFAGSHAGTLYGRGTYFAESITKSDEYATAGRSLSFWVILARVLGGRVKYTDEVVPDPEALVESCIEGPFDCVLGDREKCKGTFKEICVFDSEGLYPEYLIEYARVT